MTEKQQELYIRTKARLRRLGKENPADVIVALAEEIDRYREKIHSMEEFIAKRERKRGNETALVAELRNKPSRDNRDLLDRAAAEIEDLERNLDAAYTKIEKLQEEHKQSEGRWVLKSNGYMKILHCSCCEHQEEWPSAYCPNCGAKMKGE